MISKRWAKIIKSLQIKKYRSEHNLFLVEGEKGILEVLSSNLKVKVLFITGEYLRTWKELLSNSAFEVIESEEKELTQVGTFSSNRCGLALVEMPALESTLNISDELVIALDNIQDPGNLGTIIRTADWFGITKIVCSKGSVDVYNPKVINSTMGSFSRVEVAYVELAHFLKDSTAPIYGCFLEGTDVYELGKIDRGIVLLGNESQGISEHLKPLVNKTISIPKLGGAESLNISVACAVVCDNFRRRR